MSSPDAPSGIVSCTSCPASTAGCPPPRSSETRGTTTNTRAGDRGQGDDDADDDLDRRSASARRGRLSGVSGTRRRLHGTRIRPRLSRGRAEPSSRRLLAIGGAGWASAERNRVPPEAGPGRSRGARLSMRATTRIAGILVRHSRPFRSGHRATPAGSAKRRPCRPCRASFAPKGRFHARCAWTSRELNRSSAKTRGRSRASAIWRPTEITRSAWGPSSPAIVCGRPQTMISGS